jgi:hypothetical protein
MFLLSPHFSQKKSRSSYAGVVVVFIKFRWIALLLRRFVGQIPVPLYAFIVGEQQQQLWHPTRMLLRVSLPRHYHQRKRDMDVHIQISHSQICQETITNTLSRQMICQTVMQMTMSPKQKRNSLTISTIPQKDDQEIMSHSRLSLIGRES